MGTEGRTLSAQTDRSIRVPLSASLASWHPLPALAVSVESEPSRVTFTVDSIMTLPPKDNSCGRTYSSGFGQSCLSLKGRRLPDSPAMIRSTSLVECPPSSAAYSFPYGIRIISDCPSAKGLAFCNPILLLRILPIHHTSSGQAFGSSRLSGSPPRHRPSIDATDAASRVPSEPTRSRSRAQERD